MRRRPVLLATGAIAWSLLALVGAFLLPVYSTETASDTGSSAGSATLVDVNGWLPVVYIAVFAVLSVVCWLALHRRCAVGSRIGTVVAWLCCILVTAVSLISVLVIFTLPIALMMFAALGTTPKGAPVQRA